MNLPRFASLVLALSLHAGAVYMVTAGPWSDSLSSRDGDGADTLSVVATVNLDGADLFTQTAQDASVDANAAKAEPTDPPKTEEPKEEIMPDPKPEEAIEPQKPEEPKKVADQKPREEDPVQKNTVSQAASIAASAQDEQVAAAANAAKTSKLWSAYKEGLYSTFERFKKKPQSGLRGNVLVTLTIAPNGTLINRILAKSSGNAELDQAALASIDRAAPFQPIPPDVSRGPLTVMVPFEYRVR